MLDPELKGELDALKTNIEATYQAAEKTRKYLLWTLIITAAVIIIPLLILPFAVSSLFSSYTSGLNF